MEYLLAELKPSRRGDQAQHPVNESLRESWLRRSVWPAEPTPEYRSWRAYSIPAGTVHLTGVLSAGGAWPRVVVLGSDQAALVTADFLAQGPGSGGVGGEHLAPELPQ